MWSWLQLLDPISRHARHGLSCLALRSRHPQAQNIEAAIACSLLARISDRQPLVLTIDDLQWGDLDSSQLLVALLRQPDPPPLALILSYRSENADSIPFLSAIQSLEGPSVQVYRITLKELEPSEAHALALAMLGPEGGADQKKVDIVLRESGGSPFFLTQFARYLGKEAVESTAVSTATLEEMIRAQIAALPADVRALLEVAALAAQPLSIRAARRAVSPKVSIPDALRILLTERLARSSGVRSTDVLETYHDRIRETVVAGLPAADLPALHGRLARALETTGDGSAETLTIHFMEAGEAHRATAHALKAASWAAETMAFDRAARLYWIALTLQPKGASNKELRVMLGDALAKAGRGRESGEVFLEAAAEARRAEALELQRRAAEQFLISGRIAQGLSVIREVLGTLGISFPETPKHALLTLLHRRAWLWLRGLVYEQDQV